VLHGQYSFAVRTIVGDMNFETMRRAMVASQLRTTAVDDPRIVSAMGRVPREAFVPADRRDVAYTDRAVPLGGGRALNPPMATGRMLTEAAVQPGDKVLVVGAAGGYSAAVLAEITGSVVALEESPALVALMRAAPLPAAVTIAEGPLNQGWAAAAPYDLIVIDGAVEQIPAALVDQLGRGGRLAAGLIEDGVTRLIIGRKAGTGFGHSAFADAEAAPLPGFAKPAAFTF
jgi:protein-L-isoaspartate(D-aspartate) O-methyltransferase